jgi:hypothetical protein
VPTIIAVRAAAAVLTATAIAAILFGAALALGWASLGGGASAADIGIGIVIVVATAFATGVAAQAMGPGDAGPEILIGPILVLAGLSYLGGLFESDVDGRKLVVGLLMVLSAVLTMCHLGVRLLSLRS